MNKTFDNHPIYKQDGDYMNKNDLWKKFQKSGKVEDYLEYKKYAKKGQQC